ncbi:Pyruvate dehydrogenase, E1 component, subunit alpha [Nitrospina gracilis 3/211]|uniref:Pyruvate dehydrogenase, E1 component, subunit alpha n=1 Tax=Nitrospina gracilis (strain 3/211) TaxID=1266370 RepID=M1YH54_NITG3|nr:MULTISPECIES: thiamine pyrophosphate-dependent dehydrogenase E1 component subunit alpha [Nitrospina]MCF8722826.1 pyruvate dehydrogenase E1 component alpha subunit [Nitrospina sp. Nb-3]CCQ89784.1 Pyruvate dehydrogenase, E1 component, subunit alpha [Nitrospina gracilis 3/211]
MLRYKYSDFEFTPVPNGGPPPSAEFLLGLHRDMLRIRIIEEEIEKRYHEDQMKTPIHLVIGQEATSVGVCAALRQTDLVWSSHRTHGNYLAKGGDLKAMMSEFFCRQNGCAASRGGSMHLLDKSVGYAGSSAIVAGAVPIATGSAFSAQYLKKDQVNVVFFGDAATEEGALWEAVNFAVLKQLPIVYVCENNFYSVCSSLEVRQPHIRIDKKAEAFGIQSCRVDGTRVLDVHAVAQDAVERARNGGGPTFIESIAYRWRGHGGAGDDSASGYRDPKEVEHWQEFCPIENLARSLRESGLLDDARETNLRQEIVNEFMEALHHAETSPDPGPEDLMTHVYSD